MQFVRNLAWRLIALLFIGISAVAIAPHLIGGHSTGHALTHNTVIAAYAALVIGLMIPVSPLKIPATLTHEVGHGLASSLLGGKVSYIRVEHDESGVTYSTRRKGRFATLLVSAAGPLANAIFFAITVALVSNNLAYIWIAFTFIATVLITVTTVRNFWGWIAATIVAVALYQALVLSLQSIGSTNSTSDMGIWTSSTINLAVVMTAYTAGVELIYSWRVRKPRSSSQDEARVGHALGISASGGGHMVLLVNLIFVVWGFSQVLGWPNMWTPTGWL